MTTSTDTQDLPLSKIVTDPATFQARDGIDGALVRRYARDISAGTMREPITVRALEDGFFQIVDGHHRYEAARAAGEESIEALVLRGVSVADAFVWTAGVNVAHGDAWSRADQRRWITRGIVLGLLAAPDSKTPLSDSYATAARTLGWKVDTVEQTVRRLAAKDEALKAAVEAMKDVSGWKERRPPAPSGGWKLAVRGKLKESQNDRSQALRNLRSIGPKRFAQLDISVRRAALEQMRRDAAEISRLADAFAKADHGVT